MRWHCLRIDGRIGRIVEAETAKGAARRLPGGKLMWLVQPAPDYPPALARSRESIPPAQE